MGSNNEELKKYLSKITEQRSVRIFLKKDLAIMDSDVNFCTKKYLMNIKNNIIEKECHKYIKIPNFLISTKRKCF